MLRTLLLSLFCATILYLLIVAVITVNQRQFLYFPSHDVPETSLTPWKEKGIWIGYAHEVPAPKTIWLMLHGNGGQAADRSYVVPCLSPADSLYIMEYPGYGPRPGNYTRSSIDQAATEAYQILQERYPNIPICVLGESLGSGPACVLASDPRPPDKIVLVVPFDTLASVAAEHMPFIPAGLLLLDRWNNIDALKQYRGKVEIFGATEDKIIPIRHARNLADHVPGSTFHEIPGGHNDWSSTGDVLLQYSGTARLGIR
jgi:pimeloyl-ACP methyl ester carboxylesterase